MNPRLSYREVAAAGASPIGLVILLYEQAIEDLRRAVAAQEKGDIEARTREINHAILVVGHLQATLDKEQGGSVGTNLERFYEMVSAGLIECQLKQSVPGLQRNISMLMQVHDAWCEVERQLARPISVQEGDAHQARSGWNA